MKASEKSLSVFRKSPKRLNCAQSVSHGLGHDELVEEMAAHSAGRAPGGMCGALHAAMQVAGEQDADQVHDAFVKECGSSKCRELKEELKVPCEKCVACASDLVATCRMPSD